MAGKSLLRPISNSNVGHKHCPTCGTCLMHSAQVHRCPERVDPEVLEVMLMDMKPWDRSLLRQTVPDGFQEVTRGQLR